MDQGRSREGGGTDVAMGAAPTGGVPLAEERLRLLAPQWGGLHRSLRRMDTLDLGEIEPASQFVWRPEWE